MSEPSSPNAGISSDNPDLRILPCKDAATIAYHSTSGKSPGVVFLTGFMSDMTGGKAIALEDHCKRQGRAFLRFDYTGHGQSSGAFEDGTIGQWARDAVTTITELTEGPQILVGSSMGGWIMLLAALQLKDRIAGLIGIAAAPDFTEELIVQQLSKEQMDEINKRGKIMIPCDYDDGEPYPITKALIDEGRDNLLLGAEIPLDCPVRLIQGILDTDVPWETAGRISGKLRSDDVEVTLVKDGDHRLSSPHDLARLTRTLDALLWKIENPGEDGG